MNCIFPDTTKRVELHTDNQVNIDIKEQTLANIAKYTGKSKEEIQNRIDELDEEWDIERVLETNAASAIVLSTIMGFAVDKKWFLVTGIVGGFLLQHALQGWCPPVAFFRRMGIRTCSEIDYEKEALKNLL